jgi:hypothetical protein
VARSSHAFELTERRARFGQRRRTAGRLPNLSRSMLVAGGQRCCKGPIAYSRVIRRCAAPSAETKILTGPNSALNAHRRFCSRQSRTSWGFRAAGAVQGEIDSDHRRHRETARALACTRCRSKDLFPLSGADSRALCQIERGAHTTPGGAVLPSAASRVRLAGHCTSLNPPLCIDFMIIAPGGAVLEISARE